MRELAALALRDAVGLMKAMVKPGRIPRRAIVTSTIRRWLRGLLIGMDCANGKHEGRILCVWCGAVCAYSPARTDDQMAGVKVDDEILGVIVADVTFNS